MPLDDVIHLRAQPLVEQIVEHVALGLAAVVLRLLDGLQHRDDDLEVAVVDDCIGHLRVIRQPLHALDRTGEDLLALEGLHQVQQVVAQPVRIRLHRPLSVDGYHPLAAPARHAEFLGLPGFGLLLLRGHILSPILRLLHLCRLLAGGAPAPGARQAARRPLQPQRPLQTGAWLRRPVPFPAQSGNRDRPWDQMPGHRRVLQPVPGQSGNRHSSRRIPCQSGRKKVPWPDSDWLSRVPFRVSLGRSCLAIGNRRPIPGRSGARRDPGSWQPPAPGPSHRHWPPRRAAFPVSLGDGIRLSPGGFRLRIGSLFPQSLSWFLPWYGFLLWLMMWVMGADNKNPPAAGSSRRASWAVWRALREVPRADRRMTATLGRAPSALPVAVSL